MTTMALACPVCDRPQANGKHLAHHLAVTASVHGAEHESWLAEYVPQWGAYTPTELAEALEPFADPIEDTEIDDEAVGQPNSRDHMSSSDPEPSLTRRIRRDETENILREARELTERMEASAEEDVSDEE